MFFVTSYELVVAIREEFIECVVRGAILFAICLPIANSHFSQQHKYDYKIK